MNRRMNKAGRIIAAFAAALLCLIMTTAVAFAAPTDEILDFTIKVDVNPDASLEMTYHIDWKVLDDSIGELEWIDLGVPNKHHENITALSDTIDHIDDNGSKLAIYLDRGYGEDETVSVDFSMTQDHMYQIDKYVDGETVYTFTPAWFDGMDVDNLTIKWNAENAGAWQPDCYEEDGYLVFNTSLGSGDRFTMSVTYPNDAFGFDVSRQSDSDGSDDFDWDEDNSWDYEEEITPWEIIGGIIALIFAFSMIFFPIYFFIKIIKFLAEGLGFGSSRTMEKKITRTKITYYDNCPSCGAAREEGKDSCPYCGRSMIKSKEVVEESQIEKPEQYTKKGTYRYGDSPNTYIRVNVINVPVSRPRSSGGSHRSGGGSHHSSCACACACASSGRAGCSVKDFFKESVHKGRVKVESKRPEK